MRRLALVLLLLPTACGGGSNANKVEQNHVANPAHAEENRAIDESDRKDHLEARKLFEQAGEDSIAGNNSAAADKLERATKLDPADGEIHARLGHVYIALLRYEDARETFLRAADVEQGAIRAELQARAAWCSHKLAMAAFERADYDPALAHVNRAIEANSADAEFHILRGNILVKRADHLAAAEAFQNAADVGGFKVRYEALSSKGRTQFLGEDFRGAYLTFTLLVDEGAEGYEAHGWRGHCGVRLGWLDDAEVDFRQALDRTTDPAKKAEYENALKAIAEAK